MKDARTGEGRMKRIDMGRGSKWLREIVKSVDGREREQGGRRARGLPSEWVWQCISALKSTLSGMKAYYSPDISQTRTPPHVYELVGQKFNFSAYSMVDNIYRSSLNACCLSICLLSVSFCICLSALLVFVITVK